MIRCIRSRISSGLVLDGGEVVVVLACVELLEDDGLVVPGVRVTTFTLSPAMACRACWIAAGLVRLAAYMNDD